MEIYNDKINTTIGKVLIGTAVSNSFPLVGDEVTITATTKWSQDIMFVTEESSTTGDTINRSNTGQTEIQTIQILEAADLKQTITASNFISTATTEQYIYSLDAKNDPYFTISMKSEISRTDEVNDIYILPELGFNLTGITAISVKIYPENQTTGEITGFTSISYDSVSGNYHTGEFIINQRGYYDVEVEMTANGTTFTKRQNKLLTITPRLAARPTQEQIDTNDYTEITASTLWGVTLKMYETGTNDLYCIFNLKEGQTDNNSGYYGALDISLIPSGYSAYTFVLKKDYTYKSGNYHSRIILKGATDDDVTNANGTTQFSFDNPLVFTIDQDFPLEILGIFYSTVSYDGNIRNTVWDGRGYYNLEKGIKFKAYDTDLFWEDAFMLLNGTSDVEIFEVEIYETDFTPIMAKTDPKSSNPWYWKGNFSFNNFVWHHSYMHDTGGEGCYLGYFTSEQSLTTYTGPTITITNLTGGSVTYTNGQSYYIRAHEMNKLRLFRNLWERTGYDGVQVANATESEFCYNTVDYGAIKNEANQRSGISLQSMDGLIYNNICTNFNGPGYQLGPYKLGFEFFNNVCKTFKKVDAIQFLWSITSPDQNPSGGGDGSLNEVTIMNLYNNVLISGRYTANGRNTVQMLEVYFYDNLMVNNGTNFANMKTDTMAIWEAQKKNNSIAVLDTFLANLSDYKIADVYNNDFRIASDSPLVNTGCGDFYRMDMRGYMNWFDGIYPVGPYLGIYKKSNIALVGLSINETPTGITDDFQCSFTYDPTGTTEIGVSWSSSDEDVATVDSTGLVTVISAGTTTIRVTSTVNASIYDEFTTTCSLSPSVLETFRISYGYYDINGNAISWNKYENGTNFITYLTSGSTRTIYETIGTTGATAVLESINQIDELRTHNDVDSTTGITETQNGFTPDQLKAWTWYSGPLGTKNQVITGLTEGSYRISIFASGSYDIRPANLGAYYQLIVNEGTYTLSGSHVHNNLDVWVSQELNIGASGVEIVYGNNGGTSGYSKIPINAVLIERLT